MKQNKDEIDALEVKNKALREAVAKLRLVSGRLRAPTSTVQPTHLLHVNLIDEGKHRRCRSVAISARRSQGFGQIGAAGPRVGQEAR